MANTTTSRRRTGTAKAERHEPVPPPILPVCDTVSGRKAASDPAGSVRHYEGLAHQLWLSPRVRQLADGIFTEVRGGRTRWASIAGPYGFGKTAAGVTAWRYAREQGFTAIPPLSCSNFDELAQGVASLASALHPEARPRIDRLFRRVWKRGLDEAVQADARRYELPTRKVRRMLQDKVQAGQILLDGQCHRLVEFLSELSVLATSWSHGLIVVLDELQQLLGPLDTRSVIQFREFVWGLRTEQAPCGVVVCLDAMLEARLARWAADLLHRIRESGPTLQLAEVYTREFPAWLWGELTSANGRPARADPKSISPAVLLSLGQFVERPDLANGPRTVVDVFCRAISRFQETRTSYDIEEMMADLHGGVFRYFGEGAPVQRTLTELLKDDWLRADEDRATLVCTLAAFPRGCPAEIAVEAVGSTARLTKVRTDLFGPLLIDLPEGLALERLQQVRRLIADWEHVLARCWDTLPAQDSLLAHAPDMVWRVLAARLFPDAPGSDDHWERTSDDSVTALTGWRFLRGSFDDEFPEREVALWIGSGTPAEWPDSVDVAIAVVCDPSLTAEADSCLDAGDAAPRLTLGLPLLRALDQYVPPELERYRKYLQPEPFRPLTVVAAVHELEAVAGRRESLARPGTSSGNGDADEALPELQSFVDITVAFLLGEVFQGCVNLGPRHSVKQRGVELVRALFSAACRTKFPGYRTLVTHHDWTELVSTYRKALRASSNSDLQRQGEVAVEGQKAELLRTLFGQKSAAAGDSLLRLLGPLVDISGTADAFSLRFCLHPGETLALEYLRRVGRKRAVPVSAIQETLRHAGYLAVETDAIVGLLTDRGLVAAVDGGLRPLVADRAQREQALQEIETLAARLTALLGAEEVPEAPEGQALPALWSHLDRLRRLLHDSLAAMSERVHGQQERMQEMLGSVQAETIPLDWVKSEVAAHLRGVAKLLSRTRDALIRGLTREAGRIGAELTAAELDGEDWAVAWRKRGPSFERIWGELEARVKDFLAQAEALRAWQSLNERLASLASLSTKISESDPALTRAVGELVADLRERFATDHWDPVHAHAEVAVRLSALESQAQGLLFSRVQAYLGELDTLRVRFNDFLCGAAPQINGSGRAKASGNEGPPFARLYAWATQSFAAAAERLRARRTHGQAWRHPTRKSQSWADIDGQVSKALAAASACADVAAVARVGELVLLMRQGFVVAASERGEAVYEGPECADDFAELEQLLQQGRVRVRVEWLDRAARTPGQ
jgi:hypothetical protein